jgi:peptidoglycan/LPS O-acetylase OafA/YrhL
VRRGYVTPIVRAGQSVGVPPRGEGTTTSIPHVAALDGVRGMAVLAVLLFHGGHLRGGYLGVDLFFTLSGFLITSLLLAESRRHGRIGLGGFWARRARRLLPALAVMLIGVALYSRFGAANDQLSQIRGDALATLGYVANWHQVFAHQSYCALFSGPSPLQHTWSRAIEEQFYVIWPLLFVGLLAAWKRAPATATLVVSLALAAASAVLMIVLYQPGDTARAYYGTDTRAAGILLGAALAAGLGRFGPTPSRARRIALEAIALAGVVLLAVAWSRLDGQSATLYRGGFVVCGLAAVAVIAAVMHPVRGPISAMLSFRPLCALGLISYGVYLYHWPLDVFLDEQRVGFGGWPLFALRTIAAIAAATVSYRWIEQPVRRGALSGVQLRVLVPTVATALVVALVAATSGVAPTTPSPSLIASSIAASPSKAVARAVRVAQPHSERVMIVGNSVAYFLGKAFEQLDPKHLAVFDAGVPGCSFPPQVDVGTVTLPSGARFRGSPCDPAWEADVVKGFHPSVVFWVVTNPAGAGGTYLGHEVGPCSSEWDDLYARALTHEVGVLGAGGAKVVITTSAYTRYLFMRSSDHPIACDNRVRRRVAAATGAQLVDLFEFICPQGECRDKQNGVSLRVDGLHYEGEGGKIVARWLLSQVH